jgi:hypothetical protein
MSELRYPPAAMTANYVRAAVGGAIAVGILVAAQPGVFFALVLIVLAAVFVGFGLQTALRQATGYGYDERGVFAIGPISRAIEWGDVVNVKLSYYTTKRDGSSGWWQLDIKGRKSTMRIDSKLDGFAGLAERAVREARSRDVELSPTTLDNLRQFGIKIADSEP